MPNNLTITVCLATYNGEKYLKEQLNSILSQDYKDIEILIQDDCSTDNTLFILEEYSKYPNITLFKNKKNLGYIKNFETLLKKATGEYIAISDQDDVWEKNKLTLLVDNIQENILIYSDSLLVDAQNRSLGKSLSSKLKNNFINSQTSLNFLYDNSVSAHAMLFKKELLQFIFPFPQKLYFDTWIAATAASHSSIHYINTTLVRYRQHESNTLGNVQKKKNSINTKLSKKVQKKLTEVAIILEKIEELQKLKTINKKELLILSELKEFYLGFNKRWFSPKMFLLLFKNRETFFTITKRNKLSLCIKKSIGQKAYELFPFL